MTQASSGMKTSLYSLSFAALGVVFGDIGTSPLYAFSQVMSHLQITQANIFGLLSLIFWTLIIIISFKYLMIIFKADNDGEGGIMALSGILRQKLESPTAWLLLVTFIGVGLIIGDGMLTPAISILSAVEGLKPLSADLEQYVVPVTLSILILLFAGQRLGTGKIGLLFAPIMLIWFVTISILGGIQIFHNPKVLMALSPHYAITFFITEKHYALITLGGVFLVITGGEALFADLGHFGKNPIRLVWFAIVLPSLLICYFGQGALLLAHPQLADNTFYGLAPNWFLPLLIVLATLATIVASQAILSAAFSILKQTCLLNFIPRLKIIYTSKVEKGQVYVPIINLILGIGTCTLVLAFQSSYHLAAAYGIAINLDMLITTVLVAMIAYLCWSWNFVKLIIFPIILIIELAFLAGNIPKFMHGGWIPVVIAIFTILIMYAWHKGFLELRELHHRDSLMDEFILDELNKNKITRQPGTRIYVVDPYDIEGKSLLNHLRINRIFSENMIFLCIKIANKPKVRGKERFDFTEKAKGLYLLTLHYGFTEETNVPETLDEILHSIKLPFAINGNKLFYFAEFVYVDATVEKINPFRNLQKKLFALMLRNAVPDMQFYHLPYTQTIIVGSYYSI